MKKILFCTAAFGILAAASCSKPEGGEEQKPQDVQIAVYTPDDLEEFDLDWNNQQKKLTFEWESDNSEATYSILFSLAEEMTDCQRIEVGTECTKDVTHLDFDGILGKLGVGEYKKGTLYWTIEGTVGGQTSRSEIRSMELFRFYKPFVDPRDGEEYRVCKVVDALTGDYAVWLADNLRATKYADGTEIGADGVKFFKPESGEEPDPALVKVYGGYYTWTAAMRGEKGAEPGEKIQGVAPKGWHIPTWDEWVFLINACPTPEDPGAALKDKDFWDEASTNVGKNTVGFNMAGAGYIWEVPANDVIENGKNTYFWTASAPQPGDENKIPWKPNPDEFPNQAISYGFNSNDGGAALYVYLRNRGYNVRCVLD